MRIFLFLFPFLLFSREPFCPHRYIGIEGGDLFSSCADIKVNAPIWDGASNGYDSDLGDSPIFGFIFGYRFTKLFKGDISYQ